MSRASRLPRQVQVSLGAVRDLAVEETAHELAALVVQAAQAVAGRLMVSRAELWLDAAPRRRTATPDQAAVAVALRVKEASAVAVQ